MCEQVLPPTDWNEFVPNCSAWLLSEQIQSVEWSFLFLKKIPLRFNYWKEREERRNKKPFSFRFILLHVGDEAKNLNSFFPSHLFFNIEWERISSVIVSQVPPSTVNSLKVTGSRPFFSFSLLVRVTSFHFLVKQTVKNWEEELEDASVAMNGPSKAICVKNTTFHQRWRRRRHWRRSWRRCRRCRRRRWR